MVEWLPLLPALRLVTTVALLAERPAMKIVVFMTVNTGITRIAKLLIGLVAGAALLFSVSPFQWEACMAVIKGVQLHINDIGIPSPVVGVAGRAFAGTRQRIQAMETTPALSICLNVVVAVQAQAG